MPDVRPPRAASALAALGLAVAVLTGCGDDTADEGESSPSKASTRDSPPSKATARDSPPSKATDDDSAPTQGDDQPVVLDVTIADGEVNPAGKQLEASVGQEVELRVTSDAADELHVHSSPMHEFEIKPGGREQVFTFTIEQPGQAEIETHETATVISELVVRP